MHKLVYQVFKTIILAMLLVFVFDMTSYLYRAASLNTRIENLMTSMQRVVSENNGLPKESASLYKQILEQIKSSYNRPGSDPFILNIGWNQVMEADFSYLASAPYLNFSGTKYTMSGTSYTQVSGINLLHKTMGDIGDYGDVHCCQVKIAVAQPMWGFGSMGSSKVYMTSSQDTGVANDWNRQGYACSVFYYTYFVPDINYKTVTQ